MKEEEVSFLCDETEAGRNKGPPDDSSQLCRDPAITKSEESNTR